MQYILFFVDFVNFILLKSKLTKDGANEFFFDFEIDLEPTSQYSNGRIRQSYMYCKNTSVNGSSNKASPAPAQPGGDKWDSAPLLVKLYYCPH